MSIGPGRPRPDADHVAARDARLAEHLLHQLGRRVEPGLGRVVGAHRPLGLGEDRVAQVGGRHPQVALPEVDPDRRAGRAAERQQPRRPAALRRRAAAVLALLEHPLALELAHDARHRRAGETACGAPARRGSPRPPRAAPPPPARDCALGVRRRPRPRTGICASATGLSRTNPFCARHGELERHFEHYLLAV